MRTTGVRVANEPSGVNRSLGRVRAAMVGLRDRLDGRMHARRRRRAVGFVRDGRPSRLLFVCLGNICRSPFAEALAKADGLSAESVGFIGPGRNPPREAISAAGRLGVEHGDHLSREITRADVDAAELIVVFDRFNARRVRSAFPAGSSKMVWLGDLDPVWTGKRAIIDPWGRGDDFFDRTFERIQRCVAELSEALSVE